VLALSVAVSRRVSAAAPGLRQVLLGYPYNVAIDMWSLGCVAAELFLGLPLFPGASEHDLLTRVVEMMGPPPDSLLAAAKHTKKFFHRLDVNEISPAGKAPVRSVSCCAACWRTSWIMLLVDRASCAVSRQ